MKKFFSFLAILAFVAVSVSANAIDDRNTSVGVAIMKSGSTFKVFYKGEKTGNVKVTIYNASRKAVYTETLRQVNNFMRPYNFSSLAEGDYTIEVVSVNGKSVEAVEYSKGKIEHFANVVKVLGSDDKFLVSIANKGTDVITVRILSESNAVLYKSTEEISGDFAKVYKLKDLDGSILFEISNESGILKTIAY